ncbi:hypothetical protein A2803_02910 [Candidatus Woesebacteria bacterium RIFCSPHIGHO2_01_FULL_44_21]|uniref:Metallo-beta-lactamase domain-containing protein n=1 Tax=Candidatus Woesebacteria bacterium RIFCSPHIGHO2_01_FULL_44_21 TaxID=1802503 RepID=A0A1F7Z0H6_9BACT|nr:MAG: hypothetical protein A2803_02910 [Candidatus Woesebacteria bacterium RIFCSPHIGHO2_01_FULL_44_21]OGM69235.1 MAG: hypothetical protein A2897_04470 [Candidatus Woesebacteria bacterium RIFCSPLOWO2_01_FULL_44_24b]
MTIKKLIVGSMRSNCYIVSDQSEALIIDPGDDADYIIRTIEEQELTPKAIIATHGHFDHVLAALELKLAYAIPFYMHKADEFLLKRMASSARHFINYDPGPPPEVDIYLKDNSILKINNFKFKIISSPGHTPGSVCLYFKKEKALFVGDLIFADGTFGRTDHIYSNKEELARSVAKIMKFPRNTIVYPGHGEEFTLHRKTSPQEKPRLS